MVNTKQGENFVMKTSADFTNAVSIVAKILIKVSKVKYVLEN